MGNHKFAGWGMHEIRPPKPEKDIDCIHLGFDRTCQHKKSTQYLAGCFTPNYCPFRLRKKDAEKAKKQIAPPAPIPKKELPIRKINCSLPKGCEVHSNAFGEGQVVDYDERGMLISVQFAERVVRFQYPKAFFDKYLIVPESILDLVCDDLYHAERG